MVEIAYFWVRDYKNIKNQGINFGSEYIYSTELKENKLIVSREKNSKYIKDFFKGRNEKGFSNITAIVGENGSGKSNFLDALRCALSNDRDWFEYIIIYTDENGGISHIDGINSKEQDIESIFECGEVSYADEVNDENIIVEYTFEEVDLKSSFSEVIFYNPSIDMNIYPMTHDNNSWIDISTDWLMFEDSKGINDTKPGLSQVELFNFSEIERQIKLLRNPDFRQNIKKKINVPNEISMFSVGAAINIYEGENDFHNTPYNYRRYISILYRKGLDAIGAYAVPEYGFREDRPNDENENIYKKQKCYAVFLIHFLKNLAFHLESTNSYLREGHIAISIEDIENIKFEDAVLKFISYFDLMNDTSCIIKFIDAVRKMILNSPVEFLNIDMVSWSVPLEDVEDIIELADGYLKQLEMFVNHSYPKSFISYSWRGLSTGEKAMLNLYSRFFYAKDKILQADNRHERDKVKIPNTIYILIDEGELGFHLQWQKDYVSDLIEYLPYTMIFNDKDIDIFPNLQLIFTTHSPMSLSNIPSSNINYLRINKDRTTNVLDTNKKPIKSFGANVHSLMSDSFYIHDGLVGKFAVEKINGIISLINRDQLLDEEEKSYVKSVINIIDEPVLKNKLNSEYYKKYSNEDELEKLLKHKIDIEKRIRELSKRDD